MTIITPIETVYKGRRFRSRLEARYAVFFDALGIEWEYEPQGFILENGEPYLPDFWLPTFDGGMWAEVKPRGGDFHKAELLCAATNTDVWKCEGEPGFKLYYILEPTAKYGIYEDALPHLPTVREYDGLPNWGSANGENRMYASVGVSDDKELKEEWGKSDDAYMAAVAKALSARFEFGENGEYTA